MTRGWKIAFLAALAVGAIGLAYYLRAVFLPLLVALLLAYVLNPVLGWLERRKVPRKASIAGVYLLLLWTLAVARPERPLRTVARDAAELAARRPGATLVLGLALGAVNLAGAAAAAMPFLTVTIAYSFVAAAHFALPHPIPEETL